MSVDLKTMYEEMRSTWSEMQSVVDVQDKELKQLGNVSGETKQHMDRLNDRIGHLETAMARPGLGSPAERGESKSESKMALIQALTKGYGSLSREQKDLVPLVGPGEVKVLQQVDDTGGGYGVTAFIARNQNYSVAVL